MVLRRLTPVLYEIQHIPFAGGTWNQGKPRRVNVRFMGRLSSTQCIHKQVDGAGALVEGPDWPTVPSPL